MFTKNYIDFKRNTFQIYNYGSYKTVDGTMKSVSNTNHGVTNHDIGNFMCYGRCADVSVSDAGIYFGTGSTPPTRDDFRLESPITSGLSITNLSTTVQYAEEGEGKYSASAGYVIQNTTDADINIYEFGAFAKFADARFLMERTVLTEPITIPSGEKKLVTYKIIFNQTLNVE